MVSGLIYKAREPMYPRKDRGPGLYYRRGHLRTGAIKRGHQNPPGLRGEYWSKYDERIDGKKKFAPTKVRSITDKEKDQPHKADYKTRIKREGGRKVVYFKSKRVPATREKGFF